MTSAQIDAWLAETARTLDYPNWYVLDGALYFLRGATRYRPQRLPSIPPRMRAVMTLLGHGRPLPAPLRPVLFYGTSVYSQAWLCWCPDTDQWELWHVLHPMTGALSRLLMVGQDSDEMMDWLEEIGRRARAHWRTQGLRPATISI